MKALLAAEQALLGAVLLEPGQLGRLDWLQPDDFRRPVHGALFAALRTLRANGHPTAFAGEEVPLSWVTDAVDEANRHVRGLDAAYAHTLVEACPRPAHAPVYGRMVLEGAIHRTVAEQAVSLDQAARADAVRGEVESTLHRADALATVLSGLARRWGSDPRPAAPAVPSATALATAPRHPADRATEDEESLLAVLVGRPRALDDVVAWLRPGDFADPAHGRLYGCLTALHHRGEPIDRITVLWEAQRRGLLADGTLNVERLAALRDALGPGSTSWLAERVMRSAITRMAAASARTIRALAEDDARAPGLLIRHALHALRPLNDVRTRWQTAHDGPPPATPTPAPSPITRRVDAALSRSTPHRAPPSPPHLSPAAPPPARWHPRGRG